MRAGLQASLSLSSSRQVAGDDSNAAAAAAAAAARPSQCRQRHAGCDQLQAAATLATELRLVNRIDKDNKTILTA